MSDNPTPYRPRPHDRVVWTRSGATGTAHGYPYDDRGRDMVYVRFDSGSALPVPVDMLVPAPAKDAPLDRLETKEQDRG